MFFLRFALIRRNYVELSLDLDCTCHDLSNDMNFTCFCKKKFERALFTHRLHEEDGCFLHRRRRLVLDKVVRVLAMCACFVAI
jgi:hypothetical protein